MARGDSGFSISVHLFQVRPSSRVTHTSALPIPDDPRSSTSYATLNVVTLIACGAGKYEAGGLMPTGAAPTGGAGSMVGSLGVPGGKVGGIKMFVGSPESIYFARSGGRVAG